MHILDQVDKETGLMAMMETLRFDMVWSLLLKCLGTHLQHGKAYITITPSMAGGEKKKKNHSKKGNHPIREQKSIKIRLSSKH